MIKVSFAKSTLTHCGIVGKVIMVEIVHWCWEVFEVSRIVEN